MAEHEMAAGPHSPVSTSHSFSSTAVNKSALARLCICHSTRAVISNMLLTRYTRSKLLPTATIKLFALQKKQDMVI